MINEDRAKRQRMIRFAIPAAVCLAAIVAVALGTRVWQGLGSGQAQPMDLRGQWLGIRLASTDSRSAVDLGVPAEVKGVLVADVQTSSRAVLAGLAPGDVVTRVNGTDVANLIDLYAISTKVDVTRQLQVEILRAGRPMMVMVLPDGMGPSGGAQWGGARPLVGGGSDPAWNGSARMVPGCPNCPLPQ